MNHIQTVITVRIKKWDDEWEEKECKISDQVFSKKCPVCREPILRTVEYQSQSGFPST